MTQNSKSSDYVEIRYSYKVKYGEFKNLGPNDQKRWRHQLEPHLVTVAKNEKNGFPKSNYPEI